MGPVAVDAGGMNRVTVLLFCTALFAGSCADESTPESAERSVPASTVGEAPTETEALIAFEAGWQCERQRHAFDELEDLAERLEATREAAGITAEAYDAFQEALEGDGDLRQQVLAAFRVECA